MEKIAKKKFLIYMDEDMYDSMKETAKENCRSVNSLAIFYIKNGLRKEKSGISQVEK